jgi:hypothetical protein
MFFSIVLLLMYYLEQNLYTFSHELANMWLLPPAHRSRLLKRTFLGSFNAGTEVWRRREEYFAAEFEDARGLILGEGGKCGYSVNICQRCSGCESEGGRDPG